MSPTATFELTGRTAVVTGSSSGIGRAIALSLAEAGASVVVHARANRDGAQAVAAEVQQRGGQACVILGDLADPRFIPQFVEQAWSWRGAIDAWVNNAGVDVLTGPTAKQPFAEKLAALWSVDVQATIALSRNVGARMKARGSGAIVSIGWDGAARGMAGDTAELFAATKGAVEAFSRSLARSLAPRVRVNCVAPGWIKTAWGEQASQQWQERASRESLLGRWGTPEDIAAVVRFLASPAAAFVNGQTIAVNGGEASGF